MNAMLPLTAYRKLYPSLKEHQMMEKSIIAMLSAELEEKYIDQNRITRLSPITYAQKNFFSILFLSIYRTVGISSERRLFYGIINHCLRGLVTGTDNLLDNEYKEMLPLGFAESAYKFKSVMHILLFDRFLFKIIGRMQDDGMITKDDVDRLHGAIFKAIVPIGAEEALEEGGVKTILRPEEILSAVHIYKGGRLLCLAFVAPLLLEHRPHARLVTAEKGIYCIGISLQLIDDITDFYEDIAAGNHNYLVSSVHWNGSMEEKEQLVGILRSHGDETRAGPVEQLFPSTVRLVIGKAIDEAMEGFRLLESVGYWCTQVQAMALVKYLFTLRGLKHLLPYFPDHAIQPAPSPESESHTDSGVQHLLPSRFSCDHGQTAPQDDQECPGA